MQENREGLLMLMKDTLIDSHKKKHTHICETKCERNINIKGLVMLVIKQFV